MDQFSTQVLLGVVANLKRRTTSILATFFGFVSQSTQEQVMFDIDEGKRYMAPFVAPSVPGRVRQAKGRKVATLIPAYIKEKAVFNPNRGFVRAAGESFGTPLTLQERIDALIASTLQDQMDYIDRRMEWMAIKALTKSTYTIEGEDYPAQDITFPRDASLTDEVPGTLWSAAGAIPTDFLDDLSNKALKLSGSVTPDVVMDVDAWKAFKSNAKVEKRLELLKYDAGTLATRELQKEGLVLRGQIDGYRIWTYAGWYIDDAGVEQPLLESGRVIGVGAIDGVQHYGAIQDHDSLQAVPIFPKSWKQDDPSVRWLMSQSAPIVAPKRANASWSALVL